MEVVGAAGGDEPLVWKGWFECEGMFVIAPLSLLSLIQGLSSGIQEAFCKLEAYC